jgi:hypothetical protein
MNNAAFHSPYFFLNVLTMLSLIMPVVAVYSNACSRKNPQFLNIVAVFLLFLSVALVNNGILSVGPAFSEIILMVTFLCFGPLTLAFLPFFLSKEGRHAGWRRAIWVSLLGYLATGVAVIALNQLNEVNGSMITAMGYLLVLVFSLPIFFQQVQASVHKRLNPGKAFMITAIVFSFACYILVSLMHLTVENTLQAGELFMLFQMASLFFGVLMTIGIFLYKPDQPEKPAEKKVVRLPMLTEWEEYSGN